MELFVSTGFPRSVAAIAARRVDRSQLFEIDSAGSLFEAGKAVFRLVACGQVPGACGRGQGTETVAELGGWPRTPPRFPPSRLFGRLTPCTPSRLCLAGIEKPLTIRAVRVTTRLGQVDPKPTLTAAGRGISSPLTPGLRRGRLDGHAPVAKGADRDQVRKEMPMPPLVLSSDSHVFEPPDRQRALVSECAGRRQ